MNFHTEKWLNPEQISNSISTTSSKTNSLPNTQSKEPVTSCPTQLSRHEIERLIEINLSL